MFFVFITGMIHRHEEKMCSDFVYHRECLSIFRACFFAALFNWAIISFSKQKHKLRSVIFAPKHEILEYC